MSGAIGATAIRGVNIAVVIIADTPATGARPRDASNSMLRGAMRVRMRPQRGKHRKCRRRANGNLMNRRARNPRGLSAPSALTAPIGANAVGAAGVAAGDGAADARAVTGAKARRRGPMDQRSCVTGM